jgi:hypothetical protein
MTCPISSFRNLETHWRASAVLSIASSAAGTKRTRSCSPAALPSPRQADNFFFPFFPEYRRKTTKKVGYLQPSIVALITDQLWQLLYTDQHPFPPVYNASSYCNEAYHARCHGTPAMFVTLNTNNGAPETSVGCTSAARGRSSWW